MYSWKELYNNMIWKIGVCGEETWEIIRNDSSEKNSWPEAYEFSGKKDGRRVILLHHQEDSGHLSSSWYNVWSGIKCSYVR